MRALRSPSGCCQRRRGNLEKSRSVVTNVAYQPYDLTREQVFEADELRFSRDPFDALIVAAARALELPLITRDAEIVESKAVKAIW